MRSRIGKYFLVYLIFHLFVGFHLYAQNGSHLEITGSVFDMNKEPLPGVHIQVKNSSSKTLTDINGRFTLILNQPKAEITFSFIGMKNKVIQWKGESSIKVYMEESTQSLENVVVTGFREVDKRKLSSSITSMSLKDLQTSATTSIDQMLQGRVAGVAVINSGGSIGATPKIRIRGSSSITGNREPIWVVDGFVLDEPVNVPAEELNNIDNINYVGNAISGLSPDDIERIDILKDVSATALYGTKAANGVIVVTTKRGQAEKPSITYRSNMGLKLAPNYSVINQMNSKERIEVSEEMHARGLEFYSYLPSSMAYEGELQKLWNKDISYETFLQNIKSLKEVNTDWMDLLFRNALSQQHSITVSGKGQRVGYYASMSYLHEDGLTSKENNRRLTAFTKINLRLSNSLETVFSLSTYDTRKNLNHSSVAPLQYAFETARTIPAYNQDKSYFFYDRDRTQFGNLPYNIFNEMENTGSNMHTRGTNMRLEMIWKPLKWIKSQTLLGMDLTNHQSEAWADERSFYASTLRLTPYGLNIPEDELFQTLSKLPLGGELRFEEHRNQRISIRQTLEVNKAFGKHHIYGLVGAEATSSSPYKRSGIAWGYMPFRGKTFAEIDIRKYPAYAGLLQRNPLLIKDDINNTLSAFSAFTYTYDSRYIANVNLRTDGSNRFGQDKSVRFLPIWSLSGRWNAHQEAFTQSWNWLDELALRASYGIQGNVHNDQTPYLIVKRENYNDMVRGFVSTLNQFPNQRLRWEKTISYNFGLDFSIFDSRLSGSLDIYDKRGYDQVVRVALAPSTGTKNVAINSGDIRNYGWELAFNAVPIRNQDWVWSLSFNTGKNFNRVINEGDYEVQWSDYVTGRVIRNGYAVNSLYAYRFKGLNPKNGHPMFYGESEQDEHGNTIINSQQESLDAAFTYVGKREPDLTGGLSSSLKYKNFTLNALFAFSLGSKVRLNPLYSSDNRGLPFPQQNMSKEFVNRWRQPGDEMKTNIPALSDEKLDFKTYERKYFIANNRWAMYNNSDIRIASGDFLRCRSISLRYDFGKKELEHLRLKGASVSIEGSDLFVLKSSKLVGQDPEQGVLSSGAIPPRPGFTCQVSLTF